MPLSAPPFFVFCFEKNKDAAPQDCIPFIHFLIDFTYFGKALRVLITQFSLFLGNLYKFAKGMHEPCRRVLTRPKDVCRKSG